MNSPPNHEWEEGLDIDDSDLLLTPVIRPTNNPHIVPEITTTQTLISAQNHQVDTYAECEQALDIDDSDVRLTPGRPAGIVQTAKLRKLVDTQEGGEESVIAIDYVNVDGGIVTGCFGDVKKFLKNEKLEKIVAVIKFLYSKCARPWRFTVTLKDLSRERQSPPCERLMNSGHFGGRRTGRAVSQ
ncbi:hypothetical protein Tco_0852412, partial [Tanacetum coccineum]